MTHCDAVEGAQMLLNENAAQKAANPPPMLRMDTSALAKGGYIQSQMHGIWHPSESFIKYKEIETFFAKITLDPQTQSMLGE